VERLIAAGQRKETLTALGLLPVDGLSEKL